MLKRIFSIVAVLILAAPLFCQQVSLSNMYSEREIMNAWRQSVTDTIFIDTVAAGDTVATNALSITDLKKGQPRYWNAAVKLDTLTGYPAPALSMKFIVNVAGHWWSNYDATNVFISAISTPDSLYYPLTLWGADSVKFILWCTDSCLVESWLWHIH